MLRLHIRRGCLRGLLTERVWTPAGLLLLLFLTILTIVLLISASTLKEFFGDYNFVFTLVLGAFYALSGLVLASELQVLEPLENIDKYTAAIEKELREAEKQVEEYLAIQTTLGTTSKSASLRRIKSLVSLEAQLAEIVSPSRKQSSIAKIKLTLEEVVSLREKLKEAKQGASALSSELKREKASSQEAEKKIEEVRQSLKTSFEKKIAELESELARKEQFGVETQDALEKTRAELRERTLEVSKTTSDLGKLNAKHSSLGRRAKKSRLAVEKAEAEVVRLNSELEALKARLQHQRSVSDKKIRTIPSSPSMKTSELEAELARVTKKLEEVRAEKLELVDGIGSELTLRDSQVEQLCVLVRTLNGDPSSIVSE